MPLFYCHDPLITIPRRACVARAPTAAIKIIMVKLYHCFGLPGPLILYTAAMAAYPVIEREPPKTGKTQGQWLVSTSHAGVPGDDLGCVPPGVHCSPSNKIIPFCRGFASITTPPRHPQGSAPQGGGRRDQYSHGKITPLFWAVPPTDSLQRRPGGVFYR